MLSVGIDIIEINRIRKSMERENFLDRILGDIEYQQLKIRKFPPRSVAGSFCAKEAFSKSVGTGFRNISFKEIQIIRDELNRPFIKLFGNAFKFYGATNNIFSVSISHTREIASAVVVMETSR